MRTTPRYVSISPKDIMLDFMGRLIALAAAVFPLAWYYFLGAYAGNKVFAAIVAVVCTALLIFGVCLTVRCVHRLLSLYHSNINGKFGGIPKLIVFALCIILPVLEIRFLLKDRDEDVCVPALVQPAVQDYGSIFVSFHCFLCGVPEIDSAILANEMRRQQRYFAGADNSLDPALIIATQTGDYIALIRPDGVYMFSTFALPSDYVPSTNTWRSETAVDSSDAALIFEYAYDLFEDEQTLAAVLSDALDTIISELQPYYTQEELQ